MLQNSAKYIFPKFADSNRKEPKADVGNWKKIQNL